MPALFVSGCLSPRPVARIVGIDFGTRRVGIAVADPLRLFAQPLGTHPPDEAAEVLRRLDAEEGIETIVLGWPLEDDGGAGAAVRRVVPFRNRLRKLFPQARTIEWDERDSSRTAVEALVAAGVRKGARRRKGRVDRAAAAIILQQYLDEVARAGAPPSEAEP